MTFCGRRVLCAQDAGACSCARVIAATVLAATPAMSDPRPTLNRCVDITLP